MSEKKLKVTRAEIDPVPFEVLEQEILGIAEGMRRINATRVSRKAIVALIHANSGIAKRTIEVVLENLENFEGKLAQAKTEEGPGLMHKCPYPECDQRVPGDQFACNVHWFRLPVGLRHLINRRYREFIKKRSNYHLAALRRAQAEGVEFFKPKGESA